MITDLHAVQASVDILFRKVWVGVATLDMCHRGFLVNHSTPISRRGAGNALADTITAVPDA